MKKEIKVGDCFYDAKWNEGDRFIVTNVLANGESSVVASLNNPNSIAIFDIKSSHLKMFCTPSTRAEFDAALDARFAAIKAELPEVK